MKISILCNGLAHIFRGAERFSTELYKLLQNDYDVELLGVKDTGTKIRNQFKMPGRNPKAFLESYYFGKSIYKWNGHSDSWNPDLIINNAGVPGSYWCNKIRKLKNIPFITFERGGSRDERMNNWFKPDKIVYLTKYSYDKSNYKKKAHLPIGIDFEEYQKRRKPHACMNDLELPIFLSTSALVSFKRINLIIDAVSKLGKGTLLQTSDGNLKDKICEYGLQKLGDRFQYAGKVSREVLISLYQHSDYFLSASKHEAFGIVYLEAMASGLPVIAQEDERRKEIVGEGGFLLDCQDTLYFTDVLRHLHKKNFSPLEQAKKFDWKELVPTYINLIEEVVG